MSEFKEENLCDWQNKKSWGAFYSQFYNYLKSLAISYKLPSQDVDDVIQEVFISMANFFKEKKFDSSKGNIYSWVTKFAKWRMIDIIRRNQRINKKVTSGDDLLLEMQPDESQEINSVIEKSYRQNLFIKALKNLKQQRKSKDYMIFNDIHFENLSNEEVMNKYKVNCDAIYLAKHRMIKKIKKEINNILHREPNY